MRLRIVRITGRLLRELDNSPVAMPGYVITDHARFEIQRRGLPEEVVRAVVEKAGQQLDVRSGRVVRQSKVPMGEPPKTYLVRVFLDVG